MYTTLCRRCLTSSTELSMVGCYLTCTLSDLQMIAGELGDPAARVRKGPRVERDRGSAALVGLVAIGYLRQAGARLGHHVALVLCLRGANDVRLRAGPTHGLDQ